MEYPLTRAAHWCPFVVEVAVAQGYSPITKAFDSYVHCKSTQFRYSEMMNVLAGANA